MDETSVQSVEEQTDVEEVPGMGFPARVIGIIFFPGQVFESLRNKPVILGALLLLMLVGVLSVPLITPYNGPLIEKQMRSINPEMPQEQIEQIKEQSKSTFSIGIGMVGAVIMITIIMTVYSFLYWLIYTVIMGYDGVFKSVFSVVVHAQLITIISSIVIVGLTMYQSEVVLSLNLGTLVPFLEDDNLIFLILKSIDVFTVWSLCLLSIGFGVLYRTTTANAAVVPFSLWVLWVILKLSFPDFFSTYLPGF